jgi:hypothetical protein
MTWRPKRRPSWERLIAILRRGDATTSDLCLWLGIAQETLSGVVRIARLKLAADGAWRIVILRVQTERWGKDATYRLLAADKERAA